MNSKRRADLQRKLSMGAVPRPPADLARRIKADIPKYLHAVEEERERTRWPFGLTLRVAASIITLITTAFVTMKIMQPETHRATKSVIATRPVPAILRGTPQDSAASGAAATQASDELRVDIIQEAPVVQSAPTAVASTQRREIASNESTPASHDFADDAVEETRALQIAEAAAAPAPPPPPPPAEMPAAPAPERESFTVTGHAPLVREAYAKELDLQQKKSLFGISVDPQAFQEIKTSIERGGRPEAEEVNVDALVNYFAGAPSRAPRRGIALDVEASPAPTRTEGDRAVLRLTIDTPRVEVANRASVQPAAQNVRVEIDIDRDAVKSFRRIGGPESLAPEATLLQNSSVTALYELELKPQLKSSQHIATVRLHYRSLTDGREQTVTRIVHGHDLAKNWSRASKRHRLASLGAVWSESLKGTPMDIDLRQRAEELARQNPQDERARDLAAAAALGGGER